MDIKELGQMWKFGSRDGLTTYENLKLLGSLCTVCSAFFFMAKYVYRVF